MARAVAAIAVGMTACSDAPTLDDAPGTSPDLAQTESGSQTVTVPDPNGTYFAEVSGLGTGCPPGTTNTRISEDGLTFTMTFSEYQVAVDSQQTIDVRDCQLRVRLHTPKGRSFSVQSFSYTGYAKVDRGVTGKQMANYYWQGWPVPPRDTNRVDVVGPYDSDYVFRDEVPLNARVWSPCGVVRDLNVTTRLQLAADQPGATGAMSLLLAEGARIEMQVDSRSCDPNAPDTTPPPNTNPNTNPNSNPNTNPNTNPNSNPNTNPNTNPTQPPVNRPSNLVLSPSSIAQNDAFTITWTPISSDPAATYSVQVRDPLNAERVFWQSPEIVGSGLRYNGARFPRTGLFRVVVLATTRGQTIMSESVILEVRSDGRTNDTTTSVGTLAKPTNVRTAPTTVPRDRPFSVTWSAPTNASAATTYKVQLRSSTQSVLWESRETQALSLTYNGGTLPAVGTYTVVVIARDGDRTATSDPAQLQATNLLRPVPSNN